MLSLSEGLVRCCPEAAIRSSAGGSGLFLSAQADRPHRPALRRHVPPGKAGSAGSCTQRPKTLTRHVTLTLPSRAGSGLGFRTLAGPFWRSGHGPKSGQQSPSPAARRPGGVVILEPLWERPAGTQTHSRRTGWKLGQVRCTRQGLVRVPESNTKYGGKRGITGGGAAPVIEPTIGES